MKKVKIIKETVCFSCNRLIRYPFCEAFPEGEGIPKNIRKGENTHSLPIEGDNGITYQRDKTLSEQRLEAIEAMRNANKSS